jgi:pimeloyl-ACP methyl ester carboxylesterase
MKGRNVTAHLLCSGVLVGFLWVVVPLRAKDEAPLLKEVTLRNGVALHYVEQGTGTPIIFVHGSLGDYTYWKQQVDAFTQHFHVVDYSRRYNWPNENKAVPNYSAETDADDLAELIKSLHLSPANVVGHSYGALTGLFLAIRHPELLRRLVLAEPPAVSLLEHLSGENAQEGKKLYEDIQARMVAPMHDQFVAGDRTAGIATFLTYVSNDSEAWQNMPPAAQAKTLRDAHEWDVMMTTGILFPAIEPDSIRQIRTPVLLISGAKSLHFLGLIDDELARLLPNSQRLIVPDAGHDMWKQAPELCRTRVEQFLK